MCKIRTLSIAVIALSLMACSEKKDRKVEPISVKTETLSASGNLSSRTYVGVVEEESATSISFTGSGTLKRIYVEEGQHVRAGQLIAEMDKTQARNMQDAAEAQLKQADDALVRMQQLHDNGSLSEMKWVETQSKVAQAQASLELAKKNLADCSIYAPVSGIIGKDVMEVGETVLPALPVASVLNINNVRIVANVPETEIARFTSNTPTTISCEALGSRTFEGGSITKSIEADDITHTYSIKIHLSNADHSLLPGMVCQVRVSGNKEPAKITVPITAVRQNSRGEYFVWMVQNKKAHRSIVTKGRAVGNRISIESGLKAGDVIVTEGYQKLSEGSEVKI